MVTELTEEELLRIEEALKPWTEYKSSNGPEPNPTYNLLKRKDINVESIIAAIKYSHPDLIQDSRLYSALIDRINKEQIPEEYTPKQM